jgi:hypothetical protein
MNFSELPPHAEVFLRQLEEQIDRTPFTVLIWGSGTSKPDAYDKRLKIRKHLEPLLAKNSVFMSEDVVFKQLNDKIGVVGAEEAQAEMVDVIIVLGTSLGPLTEVATYKQWIRTKGLFFVEKSLLESGGFAPQTWHGLVIKEFTPDQLSDCEQIRAWAKEHVLGKRFQKYQASRAC